MTSEPEQDGGLPPQAMLTVAAVARRLGVAPSTLRTWDRRYGLGPSAHTAGSHRRYSPADVGRLIVMRGLVMEGVPPAEAAQIALGVGVDDPPAGPDPEDDPPPRPWPAPGRPFVHLHPSTSGLPAVDGHPLPIGPFVARSGSAVPGVPASRALPAAHSRPTEGSGRAVWPVAPLAAHHLLRSAAEVPAPPAQTRASEPRPVTGHVELTALAAPAAPSGVDAETPLHPDAGLDEVLAQVIDEAMGRSRPPSPEWPPPGVAATRAGGGRVISLPDASPRARGLARAAMSLDTHELSRLLRDAVGAYGVIGAWNSMVLPVLKGLGDRWEATGDGVDVEHAFAEATLGVLRGVASTLYRPRNTRPVLLACAEGDYHSLPLHVLAAALAEVEVGCRLLGVGLPADSLVSATRRTGPAVVFVYARLPVTTPSGLREFSRQRPAPRVLVGGPGWQYADLPSGVLRIDSLQAAVDEVLNAVQLG